MAQAGASAAALRVRSPAARPMAPAPPVSRTPPEDWSTASDPLSPEAEAFRREMHEGSKASDVQFDDWRRSQQFSGFIFIILRIALMAPGVLCFALHAPRSVALVLEVLGIGLGWWMKRARKRYHRTIVDWKDPLDAT